MKYIFMITLIIFLFSCNDSKSFINHSVKYEKLGSCTDYLSPVKIISNIAGERYELSVCMDDGFNGKTYTIERKHDSIFVSFPKASINQSSFKVTLDIDAKPEYHLINIDGREVRIHSTD